MIEGPSLGIVNATKTPKIEVLKVAQFGHTAQTDSLIKRSQFEIKGKRHSVLSPLADGPYVEDCPEVHRVKEEWEQMTDITRVCLEEASRPMEERVDQKRCPLEFEWMTKLPINSATTSYDYLSTWTWRKTEKSRKSLLTERPKSSGFAIDEVVNRLSGGECQGHTCPRYYLPMAVEIELPVPDALPTSTESSGSNFSYFTNQVMSGLHLVYVGKGQQGSLEETVSVGFTSSFGLRQQVVWERGVTTGPRTKTVNVVTDMGIIR
ncbi:uncharacterized protein E5676_scaffold244G00260 [Cucumis melo var. makuwa]|uniref:Uncharacterized protein n=1 Tax=Cucumis melo var. makuwa TaxID=1194695 RepID=A0A5D3DV73_CUCMM|nr:uncharacterized protein E5676_scaffold244G00260 [Cucumis melo var. makuwa]